MLCHGGPIARPADARYILKNCRQCHGFYGASSMERLPDRDRADRDDPQVQEDPAVRDMQQT